MARYYFQNHQINDDDWYLVDADTQMIARARRPWHHVAGPGTEWLTGLRIKLHRSTMWKEVPEGTLGSVPTPGMQQDAPTRVDEARKALGDSYQGHLEDGSSVQKHSAGGIYPYVIFAQETLTGIAYGVIGPKKPNGVLVGAYHLAVEYAVNLKGGA